MKTQSLLFLVLIFLMACDSKPDQQAILNKYSSQEQIRIAQLTDERNASALLEYFKSPDESLRISAITSLASIGDKSMSDKILFHLSSESLSDVKTACYYALGFLAYPEIHADLINSASAESDPVVLQNSLECLGKVAATMVGRKEMEFALENLLVLLKNQELTSEEARVGWARAAFHLHMAGLTNEILMDRMPWVLQKTDPQSRLICAHAMARFKGDWFPKEKNEKYIMQWCQTERNSEVRVIQMSMLAKIGTEASADLLRGYIFSGTHDQMVKVAALRAASKTPQITAEELLVTLSDPDEYVAKETIETLKQKNTAALAAQIYDLTKQRSAEIRAGALAMMNNNGGYSAEIRDLFNQSTNEYDRVHFAHAMVSDGSFAQECIERVLSENSYTVKYALTEAVIGIHQAKKWPSPLNYQNKLRQLFETGDIGVQALVASELRGLKLSDEDQKNLMAMLRAGLQNLNLPREVETYNEIVKTINVLGNEQLPESKPVYNHPIDWTLVKTIPQNHRATIHTTKGDIVIELKVNESPGSVASFVKLAKDGFYNGKFFHRVIPNFVIQGGCPRGDGMGGTDYTLRTELSLRDFSPGAVGLASSGNDTESCQWFITHMATPHLEGRYAIFAYVTEGMEIVRRITVGDQILGIEV